jgi:hypothetical protein
MKITDLTGLLKVCDLVINYNPEQPKLWNVEWNSDISNSILNQNNNRCYFIVVNDEIYKIGYSDCQGGIRSTINTYCGSGNSGRPSDRTHGIHILIAEELLKGKKVEFYFSYLVDIEIQILLMNGEVENIKTTISGKILEEANLKIYREVEKTFPKWNLQEANISWPKYIQESRVRLCQEGIKVKLEDLKSRLSI